MLQFPQVVAWLVGWWAGGQKRTCRNARAMITDASVTRTKGKQALAREDLACSRSGAEKGCCMVLLVQDWIGVMAGLAVTAGSSMLLS